MAIDDPSSYQISDTDSDTESELDAMLAYIDMLHKEKMSGVKEEVSKTTMIPADFRKLIRGKPVVVKLNSDVEYRGIITCVDQNMNIAMKQTEEYLNGQLRKKHGDAFIRGNNVLYIGTIKNKPYQQQISPSQDLGASTSYLPNSATDSTESEAEKQAFEAFDKEQQQISPSQDLGASTSYSQELVAETDSQELVAETDSTSTTESEDLESEKAPFDKERLAALMKSRGKKKKRQPKTPKKKTYKKREKRQFHDPIDN